MLNHGINVVEEDEVINAAVESTSGIPIVFGTAPIHLTEDLETVVNKPVLVRSFEEAAKRLGYSDDFEKYTLCQAMKMSLDNFKVAPMVFVNILDTKKHTKEFSEQNLKVSDKQAVLSVEGALISSLAVTAGQGELVEDRDYILTREGERIAVTLIGEGASDISDITVGGRRLDTSLVTGLDIIGGHDTETGEESGLELIRRIYPMFGFAPALIIAPGFSHIPEVAAVMETKCEDINGCFRCECIVDLDTEKCKKYGDVPAEKKNLGVSSRHTYVVWPMAQRDNKVFYGSAVAAAITQHTDQENNNMANLSPSNKNARIDAAVLKDGTEIMLDFVGADAINDAGVATFINVNGWKLFGNATAAYPEDDKMKARFWCIQRFFTWRANKFITDYVSKIDLTGNTKLLEMICDEENMKCNALVSMGVCAAASIEFLTSDNTVESLAGGTFCFRQSYAPFTPAQKIINTLTLDVESVRAALTAGGEG